MRLHFLPGANRDVEDHLDYFDRIDPQLGERFLSGLAESTQRICATPGVGAPEPVGQHFGEVRRWHVHGFRNWLVFYREVPGEIQVIRIIHGARELGPLLEDLE